MPTVTVYTMGGNIAWGPRQVDTPMTAGELAGLVDRPTTSPGLTLVHGEAILSPLDDVARLPDPVDLRVQFDPPEPFDHSFCGELANLAETACDMEFFEGDVLATRELEVPGAEVVKVVALEFSIPECLLEVRLKIPEGSPLIHSSSGHEAELRLKGIKLHFQKPLEKVCSVTGSIVGREEGALVVEARLELEFEEDDDLEFRYMKVLEDEGPLARLVQEHASKMVREGVSFETDSVPSELIGTLNGLIDGLKASAPPDYHPGSSDVVRDIVHPSLFPFVRGVSAATELEPHMGGGPPGEGGALGQKRKDIWGRPYEDSGYQWLPSEVSVTPEGRCSFDTYINNLDADRSSPLYAALADLLGRCLPLLEASWDHGSALSEEKEERRVGREDDVRLEGKSLRGRTIQVITKIVDYELPAGGRHEGVWHVEGMSHENIVATAELILQKDDALSGGDLEFQRAFLATEEEPLIMAMPQMRPESLDTLVERGLVPLGQLPLPRGRLASWPNSHIHRVTELKNTGEAPSIRRIVVFWLINPDVRIVSTKHVAPQQGVMTLEDAHGHRLRLMEERKRHKENWNLREVTLCEH